MQKRAYSLMMSYQISDTEKEQAERAIRWFNFCVKKMSQCEEHLNLIYNPFKKKTDIPSQDIFKIRAALRLYRDQVVENFNEFKKIAFKCYVMVQPFMSDTQTEKLMKSFVSGIEDIEIQVNRFVDLFSNLKTTEFVVGITTAIENIKKELAQLEQIVDERIKKHFQNNILARNWVDNVSSELQEKVEKKSPLVMRLMEERMEMEPQK